MSILHNTPSAIFKRSLPAVICSSHRLASPRGDMLRHPQFRGGKVVSVVRVNVTDQPDDFIHPWSKRSAFTHRALGAVLSGNRVLVTAELVADSTYVEFEKAESGEKTPATVETVDYEANLAILKPLDANFLKGIKPLELQEAKVGDNVSVWQLENTGSLLTTSALLTTVEVSHYPVGNAAMLIYRLTSLPLPRQQLHGACLCEGRQALPVFSYALRDARTQNVDVIPAFGDPAFSSMPRRRRTIHGFPKPVCIYASMRNPELRSYAGLKPG